MTSLARFIDLAQRLDVASMDDFMACYAHDAMFSDPFQAVRGRDAIRRVYLDMFDHLHAPRFSNVRAIGHATCPPQAGEECVMAWDFEFALSPGKPRTVIAGCSVLRLNQHGEIVEHRDCWDASRLMETLPLVGGLIGWIRKKIGQT